MNRKHIADPSVVRTNPKKEKYSYLPYVVVFVMTMLYFWYEWRTFSEFVIAIDRGSQFLQDFTDYYYPMSRQLVNNPVPITGYFYPSFFAIILFPIGMLPLPVAQIVWSVFQGFFLFALLYLSLRYWVRIPSPGSALCLFLFITSYPILNNFKWGQLSVLITLGILAVAQFVEKNRPIAAGVILAFITAIKFYPSFFVVFFLMRRDFRALTAFAISLLIFYFVIPVSILGLSDWIEFEKLATSEIIGAGWVARDVNSQYVEHVGLRWFEIIFHRAGGNVIRDVFTFTGYVLAFSCIFMAWMHYKNKQRESYIISIAAIFLCLPFILNTSWPHYFAYLPFCQLTFLVNAIIDFRSSSMARKALLALPIFSTLISSVFFFNLFPDWSTYNYYGMLFLSNLLLLPALYNIRKTVA